MLQLLLLELLLILFVASLGVGVELFHDFGIGEALWCLLNFVGVKCCSGDGGVAIIFLLTLELLCELIIVVA